MTTVPVTTVPVTTVPVTTVPAPVRAGDGSSGGSGGSIGDRTVVLSDGVRLDAHPDLRVAARWWRRVTEDAFGIDIVPGAPDVAATAPSDVAAQVGHEGSPGEPAPVSRVVLDVDDTLPAGGYTLDIGASAAVVRVCAADLDGAHAAVQTLRQLAGPRAFRRAPVQPARPAPSADRQTAPEPSPPNPTVPEPSPPTAPTLTLPTLNLHDAPAHPWRGVLLDVARHFLPKADVLRFVDLAAAHHLNVLQLHLTDDQGWRFTSHRHPRLTAVGSWRRESTVGTWRTGVGDGRPHGGSYTQDDLREIVAFARERGVVVVPEIDVPGHVQAALAAFPELAARDGEHEVSTTWGISADVLDPSERSLELFRDVLDEVCDVFDAPFVALGGDEVPTTAWRERPDVVARAAALGHLDDDGVGDVARLHGWFLARLADHLRTRGRRAVVWDEAFGPDLPRDAVVLCWRGHAVAADALAAGHDVVMAPEQHTYLDHRAGDGPDEPIPVGFLRTVADVHGFEPLPAAFRAARPDVAAAAGRVLGGQAQVWTEHLDSVRRVDYATYPRLAAFAEAVWGTGRGPDGTRRAGTQEFLERLEQHHLPRLDAYGVEYRPLDGPHPWQRRPGVAGHPRDLAAETAAGGWTGVGGWVEGRDGAEPAGDGT
ncbi:family 20 glycosylhydrolase [Isoptericola jiangsuensis]|uniref:beta-N-acetylhexosaminidase n=1 Tax=Isoptericola jiangsuensis TaxID=548579 RepID=UPI003AAC54B3